MKKVCVIIRVYDRVEDLNYCIDIIRDTWKLLNYYIVVVANGASNGYVISDELKAKADKFVGLETNAGHFKGNSQLLLEGIPYIPDDCEYSILLEADTWIYGDSIIKKYTEILKKQEAVWASAQFYSYVLNQATDFAIVNSAFIKKSKEVVTFEGIPEYYVANYLKTNGYKAVYITEISPTNLPRYLRKYPFAPTGRFFVFPKAKMATHHIENLEGGMDEKKYYFNVMANTDYFKLERKPSYKTDRALINLATTLYYLIPHKSWLIKDKKLPV